MTSEERVKRALKRLEEDVPYHVALFAEPVSLRTLDGIDAMGQPAPVGVGAPSFRGDRGPPLLRRLPNELRQLGERLLVALSRRFAP